MEAGPDLGLHLLGGVDSRRHGLREISRVVTGVCGGAGTSAKGCVCTKVAKVVVVHKAAALDATTLARDHKHARAACPRLAARAQTHALKPSPTARRSTSQTGLVNSDEIPVIGGSSRTASTRYGITRTETISLYRSNPSNCLFSKFFFKILFD